MALSPQLRIWAWLRRHDRDLLLLSANIVSLVVLSTVMFRLQSPVTFYRFDGTFLLSVVKNQPDWMASGGIYSMNLLEGIGGLWFPTAMSFIPAFFIASLAQNDTWLAALSFSWFACELYFGVLVTCWVFGLSIRTALFAAWIAVLGACPYWVPTPALERLWGNPHLISAVIYVMTTLCVFYRLGRDESLKASVLRSAFIIAVFFYLVVSQPLITPVGLATFGFLALLLTAQSLSRRELFVKLFLLGILTASLVAIFAPFFLGLYGYAKTTFYWNDMIPFNVSWRAQSFLLETPRRPLGESLWASALIGAVIVALGPSADIRRLARAFVGLVALLLGLAIVLQTVMPAFSGTTMAYFDLFAYPIYAIFSARLLATLLSWCVRRAAPYVELDGRREASVALVAMLLLPWSSLAFWRAPYNKVDIHNAIPFPWPPLPTSLTEYLVPRIGLVPGATFQGRMVNIAGADFEPEFASMPFVSQHNYDGMIARLSGNDHRMYGLWYFNIPTLIENTQFSSPFFHLLAKAFFNPPGIMQSRAQTTLTDLDEDAYRRLGVRYVLTDKALPQKQSVFVFKVLEGRQQYLYELPQPNLNGRSVKRIKVFESGEAAVRWMKSGAFDDSEAVAFESIDGGLVEATDMNLQIYRDHVRFSANSSAQSLVVLPLEYSRCLSVNEARTDVQLVRVNINQLGLVFKGRVDVAVDLRFGPFTNRWCRYKDLEDARRLL